MMQNNTHYQRVSTAIDYLMKHQHEQPSLADVARAMHLSPAHCQRLFTRWAGVSPKQFLQYLTLEHAKRQLAAAATVEEAAGSAGLSGSGRLHDLFISLEAMTPGTFRRGAATLRLTTAFHDTHFGSVMMASTDRGLCTIQFLDDERDCKSRALARLRLSYPNAHLIDGYDDWQQAALSWFNASSETRERVHLHLRGSPFQLKIWESLLQVPPGRLTTYARLAASAGRPGAARAVGTAVGSNPVAVLIPCHRVIRASGALGGYRWGLQRKAALIGWESAQQAQSEAAR